MRKQCAECGNWFDARGMSKYCSDECREKAQARHDADRRGKYPVEKICPTCGKHFHCTNGRTFCCRKCKDVWFATNGKPQDMRLVEQEAERREKERLKAERERKYRTKGVKRTETGAIWYPVSGREIERMAREQHRTYGEIAAELLAEQVRCGK